MSWDNNVYYNPENFGLKTVAELDFSSGSYEFDYTVLWEREEDGLQFWATDSGCSCPAPFEDHSMKDITPLRTRQDVQDLWKHLQEQLGYSIEFSHGGAQETDVVDFFRKVRLI